MLRDIFKSTKKVFSPFIDDIEVHDHLQIVRLQGPIDVSTIPALEKLVLHAEKKSGMLDKNIMVDFKKVTHVDSATVAVLLAALSELKHHRHRLVLVNVTPELKTKLVIAKLDQFFETCQCEDKACEELKKGLME